MKLDGATVGTATLDNITYTPSANITDGSHTVIVNVSDAVGNAATQKSWTFTVDTVGPVITAQAATPALVTPDTLTLVTFTATVNDATSGVETVTIDLSGIGGVGTQTMRDNGVAPDVTGGGPIYTTSANVTEEPRA